MPRGLTSGQLAAIATGPVGLCYFVELLTSTPVRAWNGVGDKVVFGNTFKGVGQFGIIDGIEGDRTLTNQDITLALVGVPGQYITGSVLAATRSVRYQGKPVNVYLGITQPATTTLIDDPILTWAGYADVIGYQLGPNFSVALTCEGLDSIMRRTNGWNMATVSHNARLGLAPGTDLFFEAQNRLMGVPKPQLAG